MTARFQPSDDGYRLLVEYSPAGQSRGAILFVHPFAEEMNKSRRAVANAARAFAGKGWHVTTLDLLGCGDSSGDFGDATWEAWLNDIEQVWHQLAQTRQSAPILWGLRAGALLVVDVIKRLPNAPSVMFWQPVLSGRTYLNQFLRLKIAAQMLGQDGPTASTKALRSDLESGQRIEVAGYTLHSRLAIPLERAELDPPSSVPTHVLWCEIAARTGDRTVSPASASRQAKWQKAGADVRSIIVDGLAFWQTQEIAECPELVVATLDVLEQIRT